MWEMLSEYWPHVRDLSIAYALAFFIGWDREMEDRSAGLRTFPLVAVASCGFWQAMEHLMDSAEGRGALVQGIITGIGFIGGGAILQRGESVQGTATAASLWATGAIGVAVGAGSYDVAVVISVATIATLVVVGRLKRGKGPGQHDASADDPPKPADEQTQKKLAERAG